jgi:hypothetical protein
MVIYWKYYYIIILWDSLKILLWMLKREAFSIMHQSVIWLAKIAAVYIWLIKLLGFLQYIKISSEYKSFNFSKQDAVYLDINE